MKRFFILCLAVILLFSACSKKPVKPRTKTEFLLGTVCTIKIYDDIDQDIFDDIFTEIKRIEKEISANIDSSEISKINVNAGIKNTVVSDESFYVIAKALEYSILSKGAFNVAIGPLVNLWGIGTENARIPSQEEIDETLPLLDYMDVEMNEDSKTVYLKKTGMALDLGAIAKGYIADRVKELLLGKGVTRAIINLGGNVLVLGKKSDDVKWKIGIQDPFEERNEYFAIFDAENETIVSSGVYERFFEENGVRYHHILDYVTGMPVVSDIYSVTVVGPESIVADALSTMIFSLGIEEGFSYITNFSGYDLIVVDKNKRVITSNELADRIEITNEAFKLSTY